MSEDDAWDIIYKIMFRIMERIKNYDFKTEKQFANFIYTGFNRELINFYRKKKKMEERLSLLSLDKDISTMYEMDKDGNDNIDIEFLNGTIKEFWEEPEADNKLLDMLNKVLDGLEEWERILMLQKSNGFTYKEIAQYIDKPENQLKVYYGRLKMKIYNQLKGLVMNNFVDAE